MIANKKPSIIIGIVYFLLHTYCCFAQHDIKLQVTYLDSIHTLDITQKLIYKNDNKKDITEINLLDWSNAFKDNTTPLAKRLAEDFKRNFHFANQKERGFTNIKSINFTNNKDSVHYDRAVDDYLRLKLKNPIKPNEQKSFTLKYQVKIPYHRFTGFGYTDHNQITAKYWYLTPVNKAHLHHHKNLDDALIEKTNLEIQIQAPERFKILSSLPPKNTNKDQKIKAGYKQYTFKGISLHPSCISIQDTKEIKQLDRFSTNGFEVETNFKSRKLNFEQRAEIFKKVALFCRNELGDFPNNYALLDNVSYKKHPIYGLNQLPDFIQPFPNGFQYEIKLLKALLERYRLEKLPINHRENYWVGSGVTYYMLKKYIDKYYHDLKLLGEVSNIIGIRWFHLADLLFSDQYFLNYKNIARLRIDQPLSMPSDQLIKYNQEIGHPCKAALGLYYLSKLEDFSESKITEAIKNTYQSPTLTNSSNFLKELNKATITKSYDMSWFEKDFLNFHKNLDFSFRVKKIKNKDSLRLSFKNKENYQIPIQLQGYRNDSIISSYYFKNISHKQHINIPNKQEDQFILDPNRYIPEIQRGNNFKTIGKLLNRPLNFKFFQDIEDPSKNQIFFIPEFHYNIYDGITIFNKFYNKTILRKNLLYEVTPSYGFKSKTLLGAIKFRYRQPVKEYGLYQINYFMKASLFSYDQDLQYRRLNPSISLSFRPKDLRSNLRQYLEFRTITVDRDKPKDTVLATPNYTIFNSFYVYSNKNLLNTVTAKASYEMAKNFSKVSGTFRYNKLFKNQREIYFRGFAGTFLYNNTINSDKDFFSFSLDRPTDYLFDLGYMARNEETGWLSQETKNAEGGFKSQFNTSFANQWMTTINTGTTIWNWVYAYGNAGFYKNKYQDPIFRYDSGIRLSFVANYFELFFPVYSSNGWEVGQGDYLNRIRFLVTVSPTTLLKLFTRRWY